MCSLSEDLRARRVEATVEQGLLTHRVRSARIVELAELVRAGWYWLAGAGAGWRGLARAKVRSIARVTFAIDLSPDSTFFES